MIASGFCILKTSLVEYGDPSRTCYFSTDASQVQNEADDNQVEVSPVVDETT
jgi:hypothetical protein